MSNFKPKGVFKSARWQFERLNGFVIPAWSGDFEMSDPTPVLPRNYEDSKATIKHVQHHLLHELLQAPINGPMYQVFLDNGIFGILDIASFLSKEDFVDWTYMDQHGKQRQLPLQVVNELELLYQWICTVFDDTEPEYIEYEDLFTVEQECDLFLRDEYLDWLHAQGHPPPELIQLVYWEFEDSEEWQDENDMLEANSKFLGPTDDGSVDSTDPSLIVDSTINPTVNPSSTLAPREPTNASTTTVCYGELVDPCHSPATVAALDDQ